VTIVLDASIVLAGTMPDEHSELANGILLQVAEEGALAPAIFPWEVANALSVAVRRNRLSYAHAEEIFDDITDLNIAVEDTQTATIWVDVFGLSQRHALSVYDAGYLELALRMKFPLATLDKALADAAMRENLRLV
jgi:predicted nucleic acid-binding protein